MNETMARARAAQKAVDELTAAPYRVSQAPAELVGVILALDEARAPEQSGGIWLAPEGRVRALTFQLITAQNQQRERYYAARDALTDALEYIRSRGHDTTGDEVLARCESVLEEARKLG